MMQQQKVNQTTISDALWSLLCESTQEFIKGGQLQSRERVSEQDSSTRNVESMTCNFTHFINVL